MATFEGFLSALVVAVVSLNLVACQMPSSHAGAVITDCVKICYTGVINQDGCLVTDLHCHCQHQDSIIDQMPKCIEATPECKGQDPAVFTDAVTMYCKQIEASFSATAARPTSTSKSTNPGSSMSSASFPTSVPGSPTIQNPSDTVPVSSQVPTSVSATGSSQETPPASTRGPGPVSISTFSMTSMTSSFSAIITVSGHAPIPLSTSETGAVSSGVVPVPSTSLPTETTLGPAGPTFSLSTTASLPICTVTRTVRGSAYGTGTGCGGSGANTTTTFNLPTPTPTFTILPESAATAYKRGPLDLVYLFAGFLLVI
ncbi:MAG: hypothetical protein MMC23_007158 [Stictis urceolatum]|nr:hypothetical protein [Stictis urceolata]